jgi:hypothetical protein
VAGSRREYVAADKRKIYNTVTLSSVTDACRGSDLDDRPKFNVAIIYEDGAAGKRAKQEGANWVESIASDPPQVLVPSLLLQLASGRIGFFCHINYQVRNSFDRC